MVYIGSVTKICSEKLNRDNEIIYSNKNLFDTEKIRMIYDAIYRKYV